MCRRCIMNEVYLVAGCVVIVSNNRKQQRFTELQQPNNKINHPPTRRADKDANGFRMVF